MPMTGVLSLVPVSVIRRRCLSRNMHRDKHRRRITETGTKDKTPVIGILERGGDVRANVIPTRRKHHVQAEDRAHVKAGSAIYTDALLSYQGLVHRDYIHAIIDQAQAYVVG